MNILVYFYVLFANITYEEFIDPKGEVASDGFYKVIAEIFTIYYGTFLYISIIYIHTILIAIEQAISSKANKDFFIKTTI